jgi:hypothetical protein
MYVQPIERIVRENLAAADPFYHGRHEGTDPLNADEVTPLEPEKTARDLGRFDDKGLRPDQLPK